MSVYAQVGGHRQGMSCGGFPGRSVRAHRPASGDDNRDEGRSAEYFRNGSVIRHRAG